MSTLAAIHRISQDVLLTQFESYVENIHSVLFGFSFGLGITISNLCKF